MNTFIFAALLSFTPGGLAGRPTPTACQSLDSLHPTKLVYPTDAQYNVTNQNFFDSASIKRPSCIFLPETAKDVSAALKIIRKHPGTKFAVKSGGHMPGEFSNIDDGVLIATEKLNTLQWADNDSVLRVGPGLRWGPVYDKAAEKGKIVIGGRLKVVGVAGLVIGGGISYVSGEYGFACDNVKGFEVCLPPITLSPPPLTVHRSCSRMGPSPTPPPPAIPISTKPFAAAPPTSASSRASTSPPSRRAPSGPAQTSTPAAPTRPSSRSCTPSSSTAWPRTRTHTPTSS